MTKKAEPIVVVNNVHKQFLLPQHKHTSVKQVFVNFGRRNVKKDQYVLKGINLEVNQGDFFGIVGRNGSGKSTLLKILAGVYTPSKGSTYVGGSLTPFIELGVGFNPELSGRDNVFLNGALLGFSRKEMSAMYDDIVDYAELKEFMDQKLKNYSSGMLVRLAFSIAIRVKSDIILIDEVLAVGDANFQKKCLETFRDFKNRGQTVIFISHSMGYVKDFCNRVAVLNDGEILYCGEPARAVDIYNKLNLDKEVTDAAKYDDAKVNEHLGSGGARITKYHLFDHNGKETKLLESGKAFSVRLEIDFKTDVKNPAIGVMFRYNPLENLYGLNSHYERINFGHKKTGEHMEVTFKDVMPLGPGDYYLTFTVSDARSATDFEELDLLNNVFKCAVTSVDEVWGFVKNSAKITEGH